MSIQLRTYPAVRRLFYIHALLLTLHSTTCSAESPPEFKSPIANGLQLTIRLARYEYSPDEKVYVETWLRNQGNTNLTICIFPFDFTFSARLEGQGRNFFDSDDGYVSTGDFTEGISDLKPQRKDYLVLRPGESWQISGMKSAISLSDITGRHTALRNLSIGPGEYALMFRFRQKVFNGTEYAIRSWQGEVESNKVTLRVLPPPDVDVMLEQMKHPVPEMRSKAAALLGIKKEKKAVALLIEDLKHPDDEVRLNAATALGRIGSDQAVTPLVNTMDDKNGRVSEHASAALAIIGGEHAVQTLAGRLSHESPQIKRSVLSLLRTLNNPQTADAIAALLHDKKRSVRYAALHALPHLYIVDPASRDTMAGVLISASSDKYFEIRGDAARMLVVFSDIAGVTDRVINLLKDDHPYVRKEAVYALGEIRPAKVNDLLLAMLNDTKKEVRDTAIEVLRGIGINSD